MRQKNPPKPPDPDSNINYFTFYNLLNFNLQQYPDLTIVPVIDKIRLTYMTCGDGYIFMTHERLIDKLEEQYGWPRYAVVNDEYEVDQFFENERLAVTVEPQRNDFYRSITLHQPDMETQRRVMYCFDCVVKEGIVKPIFSYVELANDFYTEDAMYLRKILESILFVANQRRSIKRFKNTLYYGHSNKSVKTIVLYDKDVNRLRLEVRLTRAAIKKYNLKFPLTGDQLDFNKYFNLCALDIDKICELVAWKQAIKENLDSLTQKLLKASIRSYIMRDEIDTQASMMERLQNMAKDKIKRNPVLFVRPIQNGKLIKDTLNYLWRYAYQPNHLPSLYALERERLFKAKLVSDRAYSQPLPDNC
jgi:hypothetical protein